MKKIIFLLITLFGVNTAFADCAWDGMYFFPKQRNINLNSLFIVEGYSESQKTIHTFETRKIYLESENGELIELKLIELLIGQFSLTQAIFKPSQVLKPNVTYSLKYVDQTENETREMLQWNSEKKEREKVYWKTTEKTTTELLNSNLKIEYEGTEVVHYGCGPSANAIFYVKNKGKSEVWYKTEVINLSTNKKTTYYINEWNGRLNIGHGMCSGAFTFNKKGKYKVRFTPMNIDGKSLKTTKWKIFDSPFMNDKSSFGF